jgi:hypothetical protein
MAHAVDDDEPRTGDRLCEAAAVARSDHRIVGAVDDDGRGTDALGVAKQAARAENGVELTHHALRVVAAVAQVLDPPSQRVGRG